MKTAVSFRQKKPTTVIVLGIFLAILAILIFLEDRTKLEQVIVMFCMSLLLLGYSTSYEMRGDYNHKRCFKVFGLALWKGKLDCIAPEYIKVFAATSVQRSDWGPISAMGSRRKAQDYVIRMFKGRRHFTLYRTGNLDLARAKGKRLGELLEVEVI